ncbi:hypothetical protein [Butyricicoccus pullicaecorum]|uniref:hypothetical protein n=1 Tax=Butyricicoccus pullicaecorum TaxID=501571 RepID=UPI0039904CC0
MIDYHFVFYKIEKGLIFMDLNKVLSLSSYARTVGSMFLSPDNTGIPNAPYINFGMTQTLVDNTVLSIGIIDTILDNLKRHNCSESEEEAIYDMLEDVGDNLRVGLMDFMDKLIADSMCANYQTLLGINDNSDGCFDDDLDEDDSFACPHCGRCYDDDSDDIEDELDEDVSLEDDDIVSCPVCGSSAEDEEDLSCCPVCGSLLDEEGHKDTFDELIDMLKDKE